MPKLIATGLSRDDFDTLKRHGNLNKTNEAENTGRPWFGREEPSLLGDALFCGDVFTLLRLAIRGNRELELEDLPPPLVAFRSTGAEAHTKQASVASHWTTSLLEKPNATGPFELIRAILRDDWGIVAFGVGVSAMHGLIGSVAKFVVLRAAIASVENNEPLKTKLLLALALAGVSACEGACSVMAYQAITGSSAHIAIARSGGLLIRKLSKVATSSPSQKTGAQKAANAVDISSFFASDIPRCLHAGRWIAILPSGIFGMCGGIGVLLNFLGRGALVGLAGMLAFVFWGLKMQERAHRLEKEVVRLRDQRLRLLKQVIDGHKTVKYNAWEGQFSEAMNAARNAECEALRRYRIAYVSTISAGKGFPPICAMLTIIVTAALNDWKITAADAFATVAIFQTIRIGVILIPMATGLLGSVTIAFDRCARYLRMPERSKLRHASEGLAVEVDNLRVEFSSPVDSATSQAPLPDMSFKMFVPNLEIPFGEVVATVGAVGGGKSTFIQAILGSVPPSPSPDVDARAECLIATTPNTGYSPQEAVVVSGTIEENILLGRSFDADFFNFALSFAQFEKDLEHLPDGKCTVVGERGTTLSGGQSHRLCIARAIYGKPDLLCLDGSLAALDPNVARKVFDAVVSYIREKPTHRAAVVVLSQLNLLPECDRILHLEKGDLIFNGDYGGLVSSPTGSAFLENYVSENDPSDETKEDGKEETDSNASSSEVNVLTVRTDLSGVNKVASTNKSPGKDTGEPTPAHELVRKEHVVRGAVTWKVVDEWARSAHRPTLALSVSGYVLSVVVLALNDVFIALWAANDEPNAGFAAIYGCLSFGHLLFLVVASFILVCAATNAGENLHGQCFRSVIAAPMSWFESTPSGRILSRFGNDIEAMDTRWSMLLESGINQCTMFSNIILMMCIIVPQLTPLIFFCIAGLAFSMVTINTVNRDLKRLSNNSVAPVVTNVHEAERARDVALAIGCEDFFVKRHSKNIDNMLKAHFMENSISDCSLLTAQCWCLVIIISVAFMIIVGDIVPPTLAPVALAYAVICPHSGQYTFSMLLALAVTSTSLERLFEYLPNGNVPHEATPDEQTVDPPPSWPTSGLLEFRDVTLRYRPGLAPSLCNVSFQVGAGQRCGIVGRTGAGKSTILVALFRLVELESGDICIDGLNASSLSLRRLRSAMSMIPQETVLMAGTVRNNLDPFDERTDAECATVLDQVGLPAGLMHQQVGGGSDDDGRSILSAGERQLLAIARALLKKSKVVCMDEPTSHVDAATDARVQKCVSQAFPNATLIVIAHRLHTVAGFDQLVVMADGAVRQVGTPAQLLDAKGPLADMVAALGPEASTNLRSLAAKKTA